MKKVALIYGTNLSYKSKFLNRLQTNCVKIDGVGSLRDLKFAINGVSGILVVAVSWGESLPLGLFVLNGIKAEISQFDINEVESSSEFIEFISDRKVYQLASNHARNIVPFKTLHTDDDYATFVDNEARKAFVAGYNSAIINK